MTKIENVYSSTSAASPGVLFGMGNPLLDISADVPEAMLEKYGLKANDQILCGDEHKAVYQDMIDNCSVDYLPGGATQNTIRAAQWLMKNMGDAKGATAYTGCVSDDDYCKKLTAAAEQAGVTVCYEVSAGEHPTGTCACLITQDGAARSLVANLAAANVYSKEAIDKVWSNVEKASYYYSAGFFLTTEGGPTAVEKVGKHASEAGKTYVMNLSAPFLPQFFKSQLNEAITYSDIVFGNETEMASWAENNGMEKGCDLKSVALKIASLERKGSTKPRMVIVTQGCDPTLIAQNGKVEEFAIEAIAKDLIVDTNGAGDAFVAGFLGGLIYGKSIEDCVKAGNFTAKAIIQQPGCTFPDSHGFKF
jgi:adenosine kinase